MRAGFARQDITPGREMDLLGYAWRQDRMPPGNDGVLDPLSARVLVLEEGERRAVLVSLDLCIVSVALGRRLRERAAAAAGAQVDDVLLACTHTHSGPWIREKELDGALFPASPSCRVEVEDEASERYLDLLEERLTVAAAGAAGCTVPVSAAWRSCPLGLGYRRRVLVDGAVQHCWNPVQQTVLRPEPMADPTLSVLVLRELAGPAGWVLWGHGSHPVVLGQASRRVSADWPGRANDLIAEWLPGFESLFVLGAAGDVHPWVATQPRPEGVEVVARAAAAQVYDRTAGLKIFTRDGAVTGVLGFNIRTGDYWFIQAKAVCLTAGPAGRMGLASSGYLFNTYEFPGNSGEGYALAYEAGAELVNMECYQALTMLKDFQGPACGYVAGTRGARSTNRVGEGIWTHAYPSGDTRLATWRTFAEGKGPIYLHTDHLPEDVIRIIEHIQFGTERTGRYLFHKGRGQDYRQPKCLELAFAEEIGACGGHSSSGVNGNRRGETNVRGLFVAGDVDGGLPFSFLGGALAMGGLIGEEAARYAAGADWAGGEPRARAREEIRSFEAPLKRRQGLPPCLVEFKARTRLQYYLKPPKNPDYHQIALWWMERIRREDLPEVKAEDYHDLLKVHEIRSILLVGEMMARASLFREESRWGYQHWRVDVPEKKPEWEGTWVVVRKGEKGMELEARKVPAYRRDFPTAMEYSYPVLSFDLGVPFQRAPHYQNPMGDPWTRGRMERLERSGRKEGGR